MSTSISSLSGTTTARRLLHDLNELIKAPVAFADARPVHDENLLEWHGNFKQKKGPFSEAPLHFKLEFPENYPTSPPRILLCSPLPHPNVFNEPKRPGFYRICLDMLETGTYADPSSSANGTFPYSGWSTSYTVRSIMMQLQTFLLDRNNGQSERIMIADNHAKRYECPNCTHKPGAPWPVALEQVVECREAIYIERPFVKSLLELAAAKRYKMNAVSEREREIQAQMELEAQFMGALDAAKRVKVDFVSAVVASVSSDGGSQAFIPASTSMFSVLKDDDDGSVAVCAEPMPKPIGFMQTPATLPLPASPDINLAPEAATSSAQVLIASPALTKTALKNKKRNKKRKAANISISDNVSLDVGPSDLAVVEDSFCWADDYQEPEKPVEYETSFALSDKIGPFSMIPYDLMLQILSDLPVQSIMVLSQTCKFFNTATEDGFLWKHLYGSLDAKLKLRGASLGDWKHVYRIQVMGVVEDLRCFHRKVSFKEDVLGVPIEFTVNPVKQTIDYMHSTMEFLSASAFRVDNVRKTVWSEAFSEWLPLYLSYDHFQRALPSLKKSFVRLTPHIKSRGFDPSMVLEVLPKLMNTQLVLLCDNGLHNSDAFLVNYFQIHRLFLAMVYEFPQLKNTILAKLREFARLPSRRVKTALPSLGDLIPIMSVLGEPMKAWQNVGPLLLKETMTRQVLWACRYQPSLAKLAPLKCKDQVEEDRIKDTFDGAATSLKLVATHAAVFNAISRYDSVVKLAESHDLFYGRPLNHFLAALKAEVSKILSATSFKEIIPFFHLPRLPFAYPTYSPSKLTECLRNCIVQSLANGYHSKNMDFSRIHRSGVSKILRKGQSYRCAPNIKKIVMEESWGVGGLSTYLDATAFTYDFNGKQLELVDYRRHSAHEGAIRHSGDIVVGERGSHKITIDTKKLPAKVQTLVFTMTSWTTTLPNILSPEVRLFDADSMTELCQYSFDECARAGNNTCVVMCTLRRETVSGIWNVKALGKIGKGTAMCYTPVLEMIGKEKMV
ncbi:hypothetical protein BC830DRAFT_1106056 [Chytriomyces sp. MP71]|nr:hypothetical protein BC830DRAFT_1106056 [Chytriomyces sp. MP71]